MTIPYESRTIPSVDAKVFRYYPLFEYFAKPIMGSEEPIERSISTFRYIIDIDGNCAAMRLQSLLGKNVAVLKVESPEKQWFSLYLKPWVHYIPIILRPFELSVEDIVNASRRNATEPLQYSDIRAKMQWAREHEDVVYRIMQNANQFYYDFLHQDAVECYIHKLLLEYSGLVTFDVHSVIDSLRESGMYKVFRYVK